MRLINYLIERQTPKLYFAHPRATYNTEIEDKAIKYITKQFPDHIIVNPNVDWIQGKANSMGFDIFFKVINTVDVIVGMTFKDGRWGMGMYREAIHGESKGKQIYELNPYNGKFNKIDNMKSIKPLSAEETYDRIPKEEQQKWKVHEGDLNEV